MTKLRVLVVDDTIMYRKVLSDIFNSLPGVEVVGTAANGRIALSRVERLKPDLVSLDVEMPELNGLETLRELKKNYPATGVVMVSSLTRSGASVTVEALHNGAFDFITKPADGGPAQNAAELTGQLAPIVEAFQAKQNGDVPLRKPETSPVVRTAATAGPVEIVGVGVSTGGPNALPKVLAPLPADFRVPVVVVQHMPAVFTAALAETLDQKSALHVVEAQDGMVLEAGTVYLAPGGKQMKLVRTSPLNPVRVAVTDDPPVNHCKPAVDYLFRSLAQIYQGRALGVIMTGMGNDGTLGLRLMKRVGARVLAQDQATSTVFGMPAEAIKAGVVDQVLPRESLAAEILKSVG